MSSLCKIPNKCPECGRHQWCVSNFEKSEQLDSVSSRNNALLATLEHVRELIEGYVDVVDGPYGQPAPNSAMRAVQLIDEAIGA